MLSGSVVKNPLANAGDLSSISGSGRSPEEKMATHSSILAWKIPLTEDPGRLQSIWSQWVRHNWTHCSSLRVYKAASHSWSQWVLLPSVPPLFIQKRFLSTSPVSGAVRLWERWWARSKGLSFIKCLIQDSHHFKAKEWYCASRYQMPAVLGDSWVSPCWCFLWNSFLSHFTWGKNSRKRSKEVVFSWWASSPPIYFW